LRKLAQRRNITVHAPVASTHQEALSSRVVGSLKQSIRTLSTVMRLQSVIGVLVGLCAATVLGHQRYQAE
jgi:TRAP-type uncharacterized transport system fused permease subunit